MNCVMKDTFRFTPAELRERRSRSEVLSADGGLRLRVPFERPVDWRELLRYLAARAIPGVEQVGGGRYRRLTLTCGNPGLIDVGPGRDGTHLEVMAHVPTMDSLIDEVARVRRLFALDALPPTALADDAVLGPMVRRRPGLRIPGSWDRFETAIRVIVGQQVSVAAAGTVAGRIAARHGQAFELSPFGTFRSFPPAAVLASADLDGLGMPGRRVETIRAFAGAVAEGSLDLRSGAPLDELTATLEGLPGVGPWTSQMLALRVFRRPDAFPASDLGIRIAAGRLLGEERPAPKVVQELAERWRPHRAYAAQYLWTSLHEEER